MVAIRCNCCRAEFSLRCAMNEETRQAAALRLIRIDRKSCVTASAWMSHMINASAETATIPRVEEIERQRRMHADGRVQAIGGLPGAVTNAGDAFAVRAGGMQRNAMAVDGYGEAIADQAARFDLQTFERAVDVTDRAAAGRLLRQAHARVRARCGVRPGRRAEQDRRCAGNEIRNAARTIRIRTDNRLPQIAGSRR